MKRKKIVLSLLCVIGMLVMAMQNDCVISSAQEVYSLPFGKIDRGILNAEAGGTWYKMYKIKVKGRKEITITATTKYDANDIKILNNKGDVLFYTSEQWKENKVTNKYRCKVTRTLSKGTYYVRFATSIGADNPYTIKITQESSGKSEIVSLMEAGEVGTEKYFINLKTKKTINLKVSASRDAFSYGIYKLNGKKVVEKNSDSFKYNNVSGKYNSKLRKQLKKGKYCIIVECHLGAEATYKMKGNVTISDKFICNYH